MKKLLIVLALLSFLQSLNAQLFAPIGARWHYGVKDVFAPPGYEYYIELTVTKDTMLQGRLCSEINSEWLCWHPGGNQYVSVSNDSVFIFDPLLDTFKLIYAFNAEPGEEFAIPVKGYEEDWIDTVLLRIDSVSTININGEDLRKQHVTYTVLDSFPGGTHSFSYNSVIIENLGDQLFLYAFPEDASRICDADYSTGMRCYEDEFYGHYETGISQECTSIFVSTLSHESQLIEIFPNPVCNIVNIKDPYNQLQKFHVSDLTGKLINTTINGDEIILSNAPAGIYIFTGQLKNGTILTLKIFKNCS